MIRCCTSYVPYAPSVALLEAPYTQHFSSDPQVTAADGLSDGSETPLFPCICLSKSIDAYCCCNSSCNNRCIIASCFESKQPAVLDVSNAPDDRKLFLDSQSPTKSDQRQSSCFSNRFSSSSSSSQKPHKLWMPGQILWSYSQVAASILISLQ